MSKFSKKVVTSGTGVADTNEKVEKPYVRQTEDNKIFPEIQIKDITTLIDTNTKGMLDADTMVYQAASNAENKYILVEHKEDKSVVEELKGSREFKGQTKLISDVSWLGIQNAKRKIQELPLWTVDDFTITNKARLKKDSVKESMESAKVSIYKKLKKMRQQFGIENITLVMGSGDNFRHKLPLCKPYKGNRKQEDRPIILDELRKWVFDNLPSINAEPRADGENVEADDVVEYYGREGYVAYRKTGIFSYIVLASDKDAFGHAKLLINPDTHSGEGNPLRGKYKYPNAFLIEASDRSAGGVDLLIGSSKKEIKGFGLKWLIYQAILGEDSADNYSAIKHLGRKFNYGEVAAYEDLYALTTAKEVVQKAVDVIGGLLPYGVQYTTHDDIEMDVDTMSYCQTYFAVAYMLKSPTDKFTFYTLCDTLGVDTSAIVSNNLLSPPVSEFNKDNAENVVDGLKVVCDNLLPDLVGWKSKKKADKDEFIQTILDNVEAMKMVFPDFYHMVQNTKESPVVEDNRSVAEVLKDMKEYSDYKDGDLIEVIVDCGDVVWEDSYIDEHRWYNLRDTVVELSTGLYIKYARYSFTGDAGMGDMDLSYDINDFSIVRKESTMKEVIHYT